MPLVIAGAVSGSTTLQATDAVTAVITLPSATGTVQLANSALNGSLGATTPSTVVATDLTTTGNTILGNASTDTLNVGNGGLIKDASGNVGIGVTPSAWYISGFVTTQIGAAGIFSALAANDLRITDNAYLNTSGVYKYLNTDYATRYEQGTGSHSWHTAPSGTAGNTITFTQAMTLDASGGLKTLNTIGVGNATPSASGAGITFPATQSASTDVNTLDDYEEGTWTPVGTWTTQGTGSTVVSHANYTKIGRVVTITTYFSANRGTASGTFTATGLPFASVGAIGFAGATIGIGATSKIPVLNIQNASTTIQFNFLDQATTYGAAVTGASMAATDNYIQLAFSYTTS